MQSAYNFFYREERARIVALQKQHQHQQDQAGKGKAKQDDKEPEGDAGQRKLLKKRRRQESSATVFTGPATISAHSTSEQVHACGVDSSSSSAASTSTLSLTSGAHAQGSLSRKESSTSSSASVATNGASTGTTGPDISGIHMAEPATGGSATAPRIRNTNDVDAGGEGAASSRRSTSASASANYISNIDASSSSRTTEASSSTTTSRSSLNRNASSTTSSSVNLSSGLSSGPSSAPSSSESGADGDASSTSGSSDQGERGARGKAGDPAASGSGSGKDINHKKRKQPAHHQPTNDTNTNRITKVHAMQYAGMSEEAIKALVEHQSSFRDMGREIAKRWKTISVLDLDRYQRMAQRDAERYKRELAEYEAEQKRREEIAKRVTKAAAAALGDPGPTPSVFPNGIGGARAGTGARAGATAGSTTSAAAVQGSNLATSASANANSTFTTDNLPSMLPWSGLQQSQQQVEQPPQSAHPHASSPASVPSSAVIPNSPQLQVIAQLLQTQQQLLGLNPSPNLRAFQATQDISSSVLQQMMNIQQPPNNTGLSPSAPPQQLQQLVVPLPMQQQQQQQQHPETPGPSSGADQSQVIELLMQQNRFLQQYIQELRGHQHQNSGAPPSSLDSLSSLLALNGDSRPTSRGSGSGHDSFILPSLPPFPPVASVDTTPHVSAAKANSTVNVKNTNKKGQKRSAKIDGGAKSRPGKKKKAKRDGNDNASIDEASRGLMSLRSGISNGTDMSSISTLTSFKADADKQKKGEMSDLSTSASDGRKKGIDSSDASSNEGGNKPKAKDDKNEDAVSEMSASGDSDSNPKKRHYSQDSNESSNAASNPTSSIASSSPDNGMEGSATTGAEGASRKKRLPRSGSDSGELSSESSWGSSEDGPNTTETEGGSLSSLTGSKARGLKSSRMYTSAMSSVSASASDSGNGSSNGSDDGQNCGGKEPSKT